MSEQELLEAIGSALGERLLESKLDGGWVVAEVDPARWADCARAVRDAARMDYLASLTALDTTEHIVVVTHLFSLDPVGRVSLRCKLVRSNPRVESLVGVWKAADWHEREAAEMFGIRFEGHPNLVTLLLPEEWEGHPLRKDYVVAD